MKDKSDLRKALVAVELLRKEQLRPLFIDLGLTLGQGQPRILESLLREDDVAQKELADDCRLDVTTLSRTLDHMEEAGLLLRQRAPECRRSRRIVLTDKGRETAGRVHAIFAEMDERLCGALTPEEADTLVTALHKMEARLESDPM